MTPTSVRMRIRPNRALTLCVGEGTTLYLAGEEFELDVAQAKALAEQGFIEPVK